MVTHYLITGKERAAKLFSAGHFTDACLCGNGSFHASKKRYKPLVDCTECLAILARNPEYLDPS